MHILGENIYILSTKKIVIRYRSSTNNTSEMNLLQKVLKRLKNTGNLENNRSSCFVEMPKPPLKVLFFASLDTTLIRLSPNILGATRVSTERKVSICRSIRLSVREMSLSQTANLNVLKSTFKHQFNGFGVLKRIDQLKSGNINSYALFPYIEIRRVKISQGIWILEGNHRDTLRHAATEAS